ncbi:MAG: InlB B-repeat-containing protein [Clostridia bacterium]|nr:InlB B-repeat-containing protein [Clostridia bacterium]
MNVKIRKIAACCLMVVLMVLLVNNATLTAFAAEAMSGSLVINGYSITNSDEATAALVSGTAELEYSGNSVTLTLTDATITADSNSQFNNGSGICFYGDAGDAIFNLVLKGDNKITAWSDDSISKIAISVSESDFFIKGDGSLTASASVEEPSSQVNCCAIVLNNGTLTIDGPTLTLRNLAKFHTTYNYTIKSNSDINIKNSVLNVYNNYGEGSSEIQENSDVSVGIGSESNDCKIYIENSTVNAYTGKAESTSCAIGGGYGVDIEIVDSTVTAISDGTVFGDSYAIGSQISGDVGGNIIIDNSDVTAKSGVSSNTSYAIAAQRSLVIKNGSQISANGGKSEGESYGLGAGYTETDPATGADVYRGDINISGGSVVTAIGGVGETRSYGIGAFGNVIINDTSSVTAYGTVVNSPAPGNYSLGIGAQCSVTLSNDSTLDLKGENLAIGAYNGWGFSTNQAQNSLLKGDGVVLTPSTDMSECKAKQLSFKQLYTVDFIGENVTFDGEENAFKGTDYVTELVPAENYRILPESIKVKTDGIEVTGFTFDETTGELFVPASEIRDTLSIEVKAEKITYPVVFNADNCSLAGNDFAEQGSDYTVTLTPDMYYEISTSDITVTVNGALINEFTYNEQTGALIIPASLVTGEISVSAQAKLQTFSVVFNSSTVTFSGTDIAVAGSNYTASFVAPVNHILPEKIVVMVGDKVITNYTYNNGADSGNGELIIPASVITDNITIIIESKVKSYLVSFVDFDGSTLKTETVEHGKDAVAPEAPVREGFKFIGWDKETTNITVDTVIKALYEVIKDVDVNPGIDSGVKPEVKPEDKPEVKPGSNSEVKPPETEGSYAEKTGDETNILMLFVLMFTGSVTFFVLNFTDRKKKIRF